jgi:membrane dipeptidase
MSDTYALRAVRVKRRGTPADCAAVIVDAHNDLLLELVLRRDEERPLELVLRRGEERLFDRYWLPKLEAGGVGVQICPLYAANAPREEARRQALAQEAEFGRAVEENAERVCQVRTRAELDDSRLKLVLSMEGVEPLEGDPHAFEEWYGRGVRAVGLTWNHANDFAGGIDTPAQGLTDRGRTLVRRFRELGVVLDLAHASEQTWRDVLDEELPFSVTHAGCRTVLDHPRNLADWQLEALAAHGGVLGMMALAFVVDPDAPTLSRWLDHVEHAIAVMGVEHVGLGADFIDQVAAAEQEHGLDHVVPAAAAVVAAGKARFGLEGFTGPDDYPALVDALKGRGYDGERLEAILSGNWLRVLGEALPPL